MHRKYTWLGVALVLSACAAESPPADSVADEGTLVSTGWLAEHLYDDPGIVLLHVGRGSASYAAGHIPGARLLKLGDIVDDIDGIPNELPPASRLIDTFESLGVSDGSRIILYGDLGGIAAARAFVTLEYLGHGEEAALLDGGLETWQAEGRPLTTESAEFARGHLTARLRPQEVVDANWVNDRLADARFVVLDARPAVNYSGEQPGRGVTRGGHIPGAANIYWKTMLISEENPVLKDRAELEQAFRDAGFEPGDTVVTYCRSGMQASHLYFVARSLGYETRLYDASFYDWSRREDLPVAP